jgi:hypothetical protein
VAFLWHKALRPVCAFYFSFLVALGLLVGVFVRLDSGFAGFLIYAMLASAAKT